MHSFHIFALLYSVIWNNFTASNTYEPVLVNVTIELQRISDLAESAMEFTAHLYFEQSYKLSHLQGSINADPGDAFESTREFSADEGTSVWEPGTVFYNAKQKPHTLDGETGTTRGGIVTMRR